MNLITNYLTATLLRKAKTKDKDLLLSWVLSNKAFIGYATLKTPKHYWGMDLKSLSTYAETAINKISQRYPQIKDYFATRYFTYVIFLGETYVID